MTTPRNVLRRISSSISSRVVNNSIGAGFIALSRGVIVPSVAEV
jgi:hypothetical protein